MDEERFFSILGNLIQPFIFLVLSLVALVKHNKFIRKHLSSYAEHFRPNWIDKFPFLCRKCGALLVEKSLIQDPNGYYGRNYCPKCKADVSFSVGYKRDYIHARSECIQMVLLTLSILSLISI